MGAQRYVDHPTLGWMTLEKYNEISPRIRPRRVVVLAADHDRIVAEAEARGWNAAVEAAVNAVDDVYPVSDPWGHHTLPHIDRRQARAAIAALRKPEVEG